MDYSAILQEFITSIMYALIPFVSALAIYFLTKVTNYFKLKTQNIADENQRTLVNSAIDRINDLAQKTVAQIEQTTAKELREAVKDGKVDKTELELLSSQAVTEIYSQLSTDAKSALSAELTDVNKYIKDTIESTLLNLKATTTSTASTVTNIISTNETTDKSITVEETAKVTE